MMFVLVLSLGAARRDFTNGQNQRSMESMVYSVLGSLWIFLPYFSYDPEAVYIVYIFELFFFRSSQDTIWSPTLYEFSTMAAIEGKEGMYLAITMAPMYLAALPVGLISGHRKSAIFCGPQKKFG